MTYYGKETSYHEQTVGLEQSERIFQYLLQPLGKGHHVFADRYYTTYNLIEYMTQKKMLYTGTLMLNRKGFSPELKLPIQHLESKYFRSDRGMLACMWKDKKTRNPVVLVSTASSKGDVEVRNTRRNQLRIKPKVVHDYNESMNGCDKLDQMISYYNNFDRKTVKWWKRLFMWIIEISQINACIIYTLSRPETNSLEGLQKKLD